PGVVNDGGIVRRAGDRSGPAEAVLHVLATVARRVVGIDRNVSGTHRPAIVPGDGAAVLASVDDVRVLRVEQDVPRLAAADLVPIGQPDAGQAERVGRPGGGAKVLHRAADVVGYSVVGPEVVELADRQWRGVPRPPSIPADVEASVVAIDHASRV